MPSPFPGMDPYLEGSLWTTLHPQLCVEIARQLVPQLRPKYLALTTERLVFSSLESVAITSTEMYPDVAVTRLRGGRPHDAEAALAVAPLHLVTEMPQRVPHCSIEIRDVRKRQLVTAIEVLSPSNKRGRGRREYVYKRRRILLSTAHLLEIDLLRRGRRVPMVQPLPPTDYFVLLSRAPDRPTSEVWPVSIRERLPRVPVPLLPGDPDVALDLQAALAAVYDAAGYDLAVDYSGPPDVPLEGEAAEWASSIAGSRV